ncbi:uncharacterized protein K452DRAFT_284483 [Aplosporella prunicola CBS 121167]|uniref:MARVEL domain-containing protein n=1 Tax=Aplosporella prunicola CBS 121167 TaxID=1176127 RepID=A0A6A6BLU0_9PEZI|nr:uncharacterized protein K452DRAFT_284483 [Aplosporella prunicola CBS 121167]KAF2145100.1 hypothetical protein K452DRAFT_284483 [Aplosporella prunicola CBS 121167]
MPALHASTDTIGAAGTLNPSSPASSAKQTQRLLRRLPLFAFPPAFALLLAHGIVSRRVFPALGLAPLGYSALLSAVLLWCGLTYSPALGSPTSSVGAALVVFILDAVLAGMNLAFLIVSWVDMPNDWRWGRKDLIVLGTYGTVFMILDCAIHVYFVVRYGLQVIYAQMPKCPHCHSRLKIAHNEFGEHASVYASLAEYDEEDDCYKDVASARESTESTELRK